ncbi:hypothetical protein WN59_07220 [Salinicoccus sediminis]|uniref:Glutamine amidotransferase domain-containing protein n=1 Tax=Salinicoccus sediminis TaxID=1432562 RepID=A0A0M2SLH8_9STAP|nr:aminodeoxychorismate/anthranilate synthase component II [Salinicoccus sediminis]KKK34511.1 hypothetical protein WN59_07220 [Salinicoccus sediminis]
MNILMIDNHDSFTYNLVHYMEDSASDIEVIVTKPEALYGGMMEELDISGIVISPGPSHPSDRPEVIDFINDAWGTVPILGICLGHQMLWHMAGGTVGRGARPIHGHVSAAIHDGGWMFGDIPSPFNVARYHSLVAEGEVPPGFEVSAWTGDGVVMAIRHKEHDIAGLQYHPEAILSEHGKKQLESFIRTVMEGGHHVRTHEIQKK